MSNILDNIFKNIMITLLIEIVLTLAIILLDIEDINSTIWLLLAYVNPIGIVVYLVHEQYKAKKEYEDYFY